MAGFNLANYETVDTRIDRFWRDHPDGRILTELTFDDGNRTVFRVEVFTDREDPRPAATGYATETISQKGVNSTSALENCETSAVGRALANLNYATSGQRASREEMSKTEAARAAAGQQNGQQNGQGNGQGNGQRPPNGNGNGNGNGQQRPPQNGQPTAPANDGPPPETPEQRLTRVVGKLLNSTNQQQVDWWITKITEYGFGDSDVTRLVSSDARDALGIGEQQLTGTQLINRVRAYAEKYHSGPAYVPEPAPETPKEPAAAAT